MQITYLGHAAFCVESEDHIVIMDPWLSSKGAFDSAWFQFPRNHHLAPFVRDKLADTSKDRVVYISHEHQDHFDPDFLNSIPNRDFTVVVPKFRQPRLLENLSGYGSPIVALRNEEEISLGRSGYIRLYVDDSETNRDSAILIRIGDQAFLNQNDCKLFDALPRIIEREKKINILACQFSCATWHPTCYEYPQNQYYALSRRKAMAKFETVARAIQSIHPDVFLASAGPPCFLDPALMRLNFEKINIFPRAPQLLKYLNVRLKFRDVMLPIPMPGDVFDVGLNSFVELAERRIDEDNYASYLHEYASVYEAFFRTRAHEHAGVDVDRITAQLKAELEEKLRNLSLANRIRIPLYFEFTEQRGNKLRVDFQNKRVEFASKITEHAFYSIIAPAWGVGKVLQRDMTWEEFALTFRASISRNPDTYHPILHAYLIMEVEDLAHFCDFMMRLEANQERVIVRAGNVLHSVLRYCPHQGGDLCEGWVEHDKFLVCPRHR